jgi:hypothetical protein
MQELQTKKPALNNRQQRKTEEEEGKIGKS